MERHESRRSLRPMRESPEWDEVSRVDGIEKVSGKAAYIDDLPDPPHCLYAVPIRVPGHHVRIDEIDLSGAWAIHGVVEILCRDRLHGADPTVPIGEYLGSNPSEYGDQTLLALDRGRFDGDVVGLVAAETPRAAKAAARAVALKTTPLPVIRDFDHAAASGAPRIHEELKTNLACTDRFEWGDIDSGFNRAEVVVTGSYYGSNAYHRPLEASTGALAHWTGEEMVIWTSGHKPFLLAPQVEAVLGIPRDRVRCRIPYVGGGFGSKQVHPLVVGSAVLAKATGRPVRLTLTDQDSFRSTSRHAIRYIGKIGAKRDGTITALDVALQVDTGAYFTGAALVTHNACISAWGCYRIPNFRVTAEAMFTNKVPSASFRATGKNQTTFGVEMLIDDLARELGLDPIGLRKRNVLRRGEFPAEEWVVRGTEYVADVPPMDTDYRAMLDLATEALRWTGPGGVRKPGETEELVTGRGVGLSLRHGAQSGGRAYAMVEFGKDGKLKIHHNAPDLGTGVYTVLALSACSTMGMPVEDVVVGHPDTSNNVTFGGTSAQRTTVQMGNAVVDACKGLKAELCKAASQVVGGDPLDWLYEDGHLRRGEDRLTPVDVLQRFQGNVVPKAIGSYSYAPSEDEAFGGLDHWAPGVVAVEIEVSKLTGEIRVTRCAGLADVGKAIHKTSAERQVEGGLIQGISLALYEDVVYGDEGIANDNGWGYRIAKMTDTPPEMHTILVEHGDGPGPYGAKGMSQTSLPCVAPAIGAAIRDALGAAPSATPFTPGKILGLLGSDRLGRRDPRLQR
ncbi:MAG: molybdopterin-dependent oxidoreductase [Acidimicrobiia bacterium]|nr:molybdopterin-dependent oxidoreductase [Acidimicrobiia bacterium]